MTISRLPTLWPDKLLFPFHYRRRTDSTLLPWWIAGVAHDVTFKTSIYDADTVIGNTNEFWMPTLSNIYSYYYVPSMKVRFTYLPPIATGTAGSVGDAEQYLMFMCLKSDVGGIVATATIAADQLRQAANCWTKIVTIGAQCRPKTLKKYVSQKKVWDINPVNEQNFHALMGGDPAYMSYVKCGLRPMSPSYAGSILGTAEFDVTLYTVLSRRYAVTSATV